MSVSAPCAGVIRSTRHVALLILFNQCEWQCSNTPNKEHTVGNRQIQHITFSTNCRVFLKSTQPLVISVRGILGHLLPDLWLVPSSPAIIQQTEHPRLFALTLARTSWTICVAISRTISFAQMFVEMDTLEADGRFFLLSWMALMARCSTCFRRGFSVRPLANTVPSCWTGPVTWLTRGRLFGSLKKTRCQRQEQCINKIHLHRFFPTLPNQITRGFWSMVGCWRSRV